MSLAATGSLALRIGRTCTLAAVASMAEASTLYRRACDAHVQRTGQGASTMPEGLVYDVAGDKPVVVARVSWNGRVWANKPWAPADVPLHDPSASRAEVGAP